MRRALRLLFVPPFLPLALVALFLGLPACQREPAPQLIEALDLVPHEVERGDRVEILGASFPAGKKARVTFRGDLLRAGEKPTSAEIAADGLATSPTQIEVDVTESLEQLFCGGGGGVAGETSVHTTFSGDVEVAFPAATLGAPPVAATLHAATLDVRPPTPRRALLDARTKEGLGALAYLGIHPSKTSPPSGGVLVDAVDPDSRAAKATLQAGDLLVRFDGLQIASPADVIPRGGARTAIVTIRRGTSPAETKHEIAVDGFRAAPPADLYGAALLLLIAAATILLFVAPSAGLLGWVERRIALRLASPSSRGGKSGPLERAAGGIQAAFDDDATDAPGRPFARLAPYLVFVGVSASFVVMPFGERLIAADLDVGVFYVLAVTSLVTIGLVCGGWASKGKYSLLGGVRAAAQIVSFEVPGMIAIAAIVLMTGSLRLQEIIHAQGGWPWEWYAFKSPVTLALFFLYATTALATGARAPLDLAEAEGALPVRDETRAARASGMRQLFFFVADWANVFVMSGIAAALFLGGWQVPGLSAGAQEAHLGLQAVGAAVFLVKAWAMMIAVVALRWALPRVPVEQRMALCWRWLVPAALAAFALSAGWVVWSPGRGTQLVLGVGVFAVWCVWMVRVASRVRHNLRGTSADMRLNPFL